MAQACTLALDTDTGIDGLKQKALDEYFNLCKSEPIYGCVFCKTSEEDNEKIANELCDMSNAVEIDDCEFNVSE